MSERNQNTRQQDLSSSPKRNRKRARSEVHSNEDLQIEANVGPLLLEGTPIPGAPVYIRTIAPYPYTFSSFAKARWLGRTVLDVYSTEFGSLPASYYEIAIQQGRILVCDKPVNTSYTIMENDILSHTVHRHEPAVAVSMNESPYVKIVANSDEIIAVDKPGTLPIHPCGGYHENSLLNLLEKEGYGKLHAIHRLDRLTSGLVMLAKTSKVCKQWTRVIQRREQCEKLYLARVRGKFPVSCPTTLPMLGAESSSLPVFGEWLEDGAVKPKKKNGETDTYEKARERNAHGYWITDSMDRPLSGISLDEFAKGATSAETWLRFLDGRGVVETEGSTDCSQMKWFHLACPTRIVDPKIGVCVCGSFDDLDQMTYKKTVKPAETSFAMVAYDPKSDSSVVLCRPKTGRTHQIRIHLQYLGHSIANDPNYGGDMWFGNESGALACKKAQAILDSADQERDHGLATRENDPTHATPASMEEVGEMSRMVRLEDEPLPTFIQRTCLWCARNPTCRDDKETLEFIVRSQGIWLHALQYSITSDDAKRTAYRTQLPPWSLV